MTEKYYNKIKNARVFRGLTERELRTVLRSIAVRESVCERNVILAEAESVAQEFILLTSGRIQGVGYHLDGSFDLIQLFVPGELIGLDVVCSSTHKWPYRLTALDVCTMLRVEYSSLFSRAIPRNIGEILRANIIEALANDSLRRLHKIDVLYRRSLRERIVVFLRHIAVMSGSRDFHINMDREQFARFLGVNRSALSHELGKMKEEGLLDFHKGHFTILSEELLR
ncbi:MAG: helix-turn-helix domain-containing protein [Clostridiales Family XIII bacterium]|jgi:CRP-like cAMP-binding protein|nr:helix-turn-helix domain-containing protein [Clostridiales Family XIII bacterium]